MGSFWAEVDYEVAHGADRLLEDPLEAQAEESQPGGVGALRAAAP